MPSYDKIAEDRAMSKNGFKKSTFWSLYSSGEEGQ